MTTKIELKLLKTEMNKIFYKTELKLKRYLV